MPWNEESYPAAMKSLEPPVRRKAVEIANALLEEQYEEGRAIAISIAQARRWAANRADDRQARCLHVVPHPQGWAVRRTDAEKAMFVFDRKTQARDKALELGRAEGVAVAVHGAEGDIQDQVDFGASLDS